MAVAQRDLVSSLGDHHFLVFTLPAFQVSLIPPMSGGIASASTWKQPPGLPAPASPSPTCLSILHHHLHTGQLDTEFWFFFFHQSLFQQQCSAWFCFQTHRQHAGRPVWHLSLPDKGGSIVIDFLLGHISSFKNILL